MKLNILFGVIFCLLALFCMAYYPVSARVADHIRFGYTGTLFFFGAYFLSKVKND